MSMGKAVISTSQAVQGINLEVKKVLEIEDNPQKLAGKVIDLLNHNKLRRKQLGTAARDFILQHHNWNKNLCDFVREKNAVFVPKKQALRGIMLSLNIPKTPLHGAEAMI